MGRPKIMNDMKRTIVQLEHHDYDALVNKLKQERISVSQFFRDAVAVKLKEKTKCR